MGAERNSGKSRRLHLVSGVPTDSLSPDSRMAEVLEALPGARRALFSRYHLGGCQSCAFSPDETLADLCVRAGGHDPQEMLDHLLAANEHDRAMLIAPTELAERLAQSDAPLLVDCRTREEHEAVTLPGSRFLNEELQQELFGGDPDRAIVLFDHLGQQVLDRCSWFHGHGLRHTLGLEGGIDAWSREVDPGVRRYRLELD